MNRRRHAVRVVISVGCAGLALAAAGASAPTAGTCDLAPCAGIASAVERLDCYDTLAGRLPPAATQPTAAGTAVASPSSAGSALPQPQTSQADVPDFGRSPATVRAAPQGPDSIKAVVAKVTEDQLGRAYVLLDNGQTWAISESGVVLRAGDPVTIKRASFGSFLMMAPGKHSYRVRRTQ